MKKSQAAFPLHTTFRPALRIRPLVAVVHNIRFCRAPWEADSRGGVRNKGVRKQEALFSVCSQ